MVAALQAAWSAIVTTPVPVEDPASEVFRADHLRLVLEAAVRGGGDTDTVAAIAGALLGAAYGASAVPSHWRLLLHGWPGLTTRGLIQLATKIVNKGLPEDFDFSYGAWRGVRNPVRHPHDEKVWIGGAASPAQTALRRRCDRLFVPCRGWAFAGRRETPRCPPDRQRG